MGIPCFVKSPERSSYSNGPNTTLGAGFSWLPTGLRSYHKSPRISDFRIEVKFKGKCIGPPIPRSLHCARVHKTSYKFRQGEKRNADERVHKREDKNTID